MREAFKKPLTSDRRYALFKAQMSREYFVFEAVYSDETGQYVSKPEPEIGEKVKVWLRTARNGADKVSLISGNAVLEMQISRTEGLFDYYAVEMDVAERVRYGFSVEFDGMVYYYNKRGIFMDRDEDYDFVITPGFKTPDWAKGAVYYQIYVDRFYNGDKSNDVVNNEYTYLSRPAKKIEDWSTPVEPDDIANFYGGDLQGVIDKLDYLKELGVQVIYLNPIFVSPSNHKYDVQDYDYVDPHFGVIVKDGGNPLFFEKYHNRYATMYMKRTTNRANLEAGNRLFAKLIELAHAQGMYVILDGVFNHCGAFNKWLDRENFYGANGYPAGAYRDKDSKYKSYFRWYDDAWPNNECYDSWWGHENHPKLYFEGSPELREYIMKIGRKWVSPPFNADGWRLDVAADLGYSKEFNHKFWEDFRTAVKDANPNALIFAEHYGDPSEWLDGKQWDSVMNYDAFMEPITWFLTGMEKHSEEYRGDLFCNAIAFEDAMRYHMSRFSYPSLYTAMNGLSNHDHSRFLTRTNMTPGRLHTLGAKRAEIGTNIGIMMEATTFMMAWPGAPTVYYGDEAGMFGWTDPDNRRPYPWGNENRVLLSFYKELIKIHKENSALITGSFEYLYMNYGIISFGRWNDENMIVCILNNNNVRKEISVPVWKIGVPPTAVMTALIESWRDSYTALNIEYKVVGGHVNVGMEPYSSLLLKYEVEKRCAETVS